MVFKYSVDAVQVLVSEVHQFFKQPDPSMKDRAIYNYTGKKQKSFRKERKLFGLYQNLEKSHEV
jgi:hypothetical protein